MAAWRMWLYSIPLLVFASESPLAAHADDPPKPATWLLPVADVDADPKIPTLEQAVGHAWGREISSHAEIERYCRALAEAAPDRCRLVSYGRSYQGKSLNYL